jgi:hypothetical protein
MQNDILNRHLALALTDEAIRILFPELDCAASDRVERAGGVSQERNASSDAHEAGPTCTSREPHLHEVSETPLRRSSAEALSGTPATRGGSVSPCTPWATLLAKPTPGNEVGKGGDRARERALEAALEAALEQVEELTERLQDQK